MIAKKFDLDKIKSALSHENQKYLSSLDIFDTISSTNNYLLERAKQDGKSGSFCFAEKQTKGRGRQDKKWLTSTGDLCFSCLWHFKKNEQNFSSLSLVVAVSVLTALKKYGVKDQFQLKWPNDIFYNEKKVAGILLESINLKNYFAVVIGIGLNLSPSTITHATHLNIEDRNVLAGGIVNELITNLNIFAEQGFEPFRETWLQYDMFQGKNVVVITPQESFTGVMLGVETNGEIQIKTSRDEIKTFSYGDVSLRTGSR